MSGDQYFLLNDTDKDYLITDFPKTRSNWKFVELTEPSSISGIDISVDDYRIYGDRYEDGKLTISTTGGKNFDLSKVPDGFKVAVKKENRRDDEYGYIQVNINKVYSEKVIDEDENFVISLKADAGKLTKPYDGKTVTTLSNDVVSVTYNGTEFTEYTVSIVEEGGATNVGTYAIKVTPNQGNSLKLTGSKEVEDAYEITAAKLTVTIEDQVITLPEDKVDATKYSITNGIVGKENVTLTGNITYDETTAKTPGIHTEALTGSNIKLVEDNDVNKNYVLETITAGDLTVKYNLTDENWEQVLDVKVDGNGTYTYNGKAHGATVTGKDNIDLSQYIDVIYRLKIDNDKTQEIEGEPTDAGDYEIVVKIKEQYKDYFDAGEVGLATVGEIKINPAAITITGSMTITEGDKLNESYGFNDISGLTEKGIIESERDDVRAQITITPKEDTETTVGTHDDAFNIAVNNSNYQISEESKISLAVSKDEDKWAEGEITQGTVTVYVNEDGDVVGANPGGGSAETKTATIFAKEVLDDWSFAAGPILSSEKEYDLTWTVTEYGDLTISGTDASIEDNATVKVKVEKEGEEATEGYMTVTFKKVIEIEDGDITKGGEDQNGNGTLEEGELLYGEGKHVIYDGEPHVLDALVLNIDGTETEPISAGYSVSYKGEGLDAEGYPVDAGEYTATVEFYPTSGYTGTVNLEITIAPRPLELTFEFERIEEGETLYYTGIDTDDLVPGEQISDNNIDVTFKTSEPDANGYCDVYIENIAFYADDNFNPDNYDIYVQAGTVQIHLTHAEGSDTYTPAEDEGNGDFNNPVGDVEVVDQSGQSSSGITYKRYELKLANKDFYPVNCREDYAAEGIELLSRHDKKTTWEGGSFTVYYKHDGIENDGGYRVFIRRGDYGDKWEEIEQDITGYYQIRNVYSNIYVKLYYGTGFPVANEEISATEARAYAQANKIVVITPEPTDVQIISMTGAVVATDQVTGQHEFANLMEGIYIVRMGDTVVKLQVRN